MRLFDLLHQLLATLLTLAWLSCRCPVVVAAAADLQQPAHHRHRIPRAMIPDPGEPQRLWPAKKAVAFFKISFSISRRLTCRCNSATFSFSASGSSGSGPCDSSAWRTQPAFLSHRHSVLVGMPKSLAATAGSRPSTRTRSIACCLNCALYSLFLRLPCTNRSFLKLILLRQLPL